MSLIKAINSRATSQAALRNTLNYIYKEKKAPAPLRFVTGDYMEADITANSVYQAFQETKEFWDKTSGRQYKHFVVAFHKDESITPEETLMFAKEWAEECFPSYQCALASHIDADHCHCHVIVNSVSSVDGRKLNLSKKQFQHMKDVNDSLCEKYGLSVCEKGKHFDGTDIEEGTIHSWDKKDYNQNTKKRSVKNSCINAVIACAARATSKDEFIDMMETYGFSVAWEDNRKYITFTEIESGKKFRDKNLSESYTMNITKEALEYAFNRNRTIQRERDHFASERERDSRILEGDVREAIQAFRDPHRDHRTTAEKNIGVAEKLHSNDRREFGVKRFAGEIHFRKYQLEPVTRWVKRVISSFNKHLEQLRPFRPNAAGDGVRINYEARDLAETIERYRCYIIRNLYNLKHLQKSCSADDPSYHASVRRYHNAIIETMSDYEYILNNTDHVTLVLAQINRSRYRSEQEAISLKNLHEYNIGPSAVPPKQVSREFCVLSAEVDKYFADIGSALDAKSEEYHIERPIFEPVISHGTLR